MISFVIPVFEKVNFTKSCLEDLSKILIEFEIIIVDNSKTNETELFCANYNKIKNFKYIKSNINTFSNACNIGYQNAKYDIVCFLNNDIRVKSDFETWPNLLINKLKENSNSIIGPTGGFLNKEFNFKYETRDINKPINYISGWCLCSYKQTLKELEEEPSCPFSNSFKFYFEDTDLSFRATQKGIDLILQDIPVTHFGHISTDKTQISQLYQAGRKIFIQRAKIKNYIP